ncbi:type II toxin-antitoxin system PemK/MazF family toxin [Novispirillum itersonii]|uniref:type II toxin-antitoxin system PemK/MazF family toxin n=1 Tax=Novispirillum itersonii TaxID=189 RepID=UPI0009DBFD0D|nr:type II toxin-antitoxin system PemK/MazF family toxin [Novispirillum itersonii]
MTTPLIDEVDAPVGKGVIRSAPKVRAVYWCRLWGDAVRPEFWKRRPVVVMSYNNTLDGHCLVLPMTTKPQDGNKWAHRLPVNYVDPKVETWVVCNHLMTVATARLSSVKGQVPRLTESEFRPLLEKALKWMPPLKMPEPPVS